MEPKSSSRGGSTDERGPASVHLGEIHTGVLQNSVPITADIARSVLSTLPHRSVRIWERPIRYAASPEALTGLDHDLPSGSGMRVRGIGTLATELCVTAGRLLQAATRTTVVQSTSGRRLSWSSYLARPAVVEAIGRLTPQDVTDGFLGKGADSGFGLGAVCTQWMGWAQSADCLDHSSPFPARRTRLRWAAVPGSPSRITFRVHDESLRTVRITAPSPLLPGLPELCRDLALHDWLLSSLVSLIDTASIGQRDRGNVLSRLGPAVDHLMHAWMPAARSRAVGNEAGRDEAAGFWAALERGSGLSRQWENTVHQVRDQVALAAAMRHASGTSPVRTRSTGTPIR